MSENEVVYSDVKFARGKGKADTTAPTVDDSTFYSEVRIQKKQPRSEPPDAQQPTASGRSKVTAERVALLVLGALLTAAVVALGMIVVNMKSLEGLRKEWEAERKNLTERLKMKQNITVKPVCPQPTQRPETQTCKKCEKNWQEFQGNCYQFSTYQLNWQQSQQNCSDQDGNLVKINSEKEQRFLTKEVAGLMTQAEEKFWIGLTDSEDEGHWVWTDGSALDKSMTYWLVHEPDNWKGENFEGEDCVRMGERNNPNEVMIWTDKSCEILQRFICEKAATDGKKHFSCV